MAKKKEETAVKAAPVRKDVDLDGVKVVYVDSPSRIQRVYEKRKLTQPELTKGDVFVHVEVEKDGQRYTGLSQTLKVLDKADYEALLNAYSTGEPIDLTIRVDDYSKKTGNYFFFVNNHVSVDALYDDVAADKPVSQSTNKAPIANLIDMADM